MLSFSSHMLHVLCVKRLRTVSFGAQLLVAERRVSEFFPGYGSISVSLKRLDPLARLTGLRALCRKASLNRSLDRSLFEPLLGLDGRYLRAPSWEPKGLAQRRAARNLVGESCCVNASSNFLKVVGGVRACRSKGAGTFCLLNAFGKGLGTRRFSQLLVSTAALWSLKSGHLDTTGDAPDVSRSAFRKGFSFEPTLRSPLPDRLLKNLEGDKDECRPSLGGVCVFFSVLNSCTGVFKCIFCSVSTNKQAHSLMGRGVYLLSSWVLLPKRLSCRYRTFSSCRNLNI